MAPDSSDPIILVSMGPGHTAFTLMPMAAPSRAAPLGGRAPAVLGAMYGLSPPTPINPATDEVLTIEPPPLDAIAAITCLRPRNTPRRLTATTRSKTSIG